MGIPLTNFTVLKYIADSVDIEIKPHKFQSIEMELALDSLKEYSVFAFIIHDPNEHHEFHSFLQRHFQSLHNTSGEHLVFFGLVDSPKKLSLVGRRPLYQDIRDMVTTYEDEETNDGSYSAFAIATSLGISPDMLPAIIVTRDTRLESFRYYKTCSDELEKQFSRLTSISYEMNHHKQNSNLSLTDKQTILYELLDKEELDLCKGMGLCNLTESMARALSDIMSFLVPDGSNHNQRYVKKIAAEQNRSSIDRLIKSVGQLKREIEWIEKEKFEDHSIFSLINELNIKLAIFLKMYHQKEMPPMVEPIPIKKEWLEPHTWNFLMTGLEVSSFLQMRQSELDYSASAICLAKMFEQEINNSFVHWVRKKNEIHLPKYYNKVQPGVNAYVTTGNSTQVNLNKKKFGTWQPPELGKSMYIAMDYIREADWAAMGINHSDEFLQEWRTIHSIRNKAAHTDEVTWSDFKKMKQSLIKIADRHVLEKLSLLKKNLKGVMV